MSAAEPVQELGRRGVAAVKRWIEATTFIELPFEVYNHPWQCTVTHLSGTKLFDLHGYYLHEGRDPITVECKKYSTPGGQHQEFKKFLSIAYGATVVERNNFGRSAPRHHYMWVTYHPFAQTNWMQLETAQQMREALLENQSYLGGAQLDQDLVHSVVENVSVLVLNPKQEALTMSPRELQKVHQVLNRKKETL